MEDQGLGSHGEGQPLPLGKHLKAAESANTPRAFARRLWVEALGDEMRTTRRILMGPWAIVPAAVIVLGALIFIPPALEGRGSHPVLKMLGLIGLLAVAPLPIVLVRTWRDVRREKRTVQDAASALRAYYRLGWEARASAFYLLTPPAAARAECPSPGSWLMHWKKFVRSATRDLQLYIAQYHDMDEIHADHVDWRAYMNVEVKRAETSKSGNKARVAYEITYPTLVDQGGRDLRRYERMGHPPPMFEARGVATLVRTSTGVWLIAGGPINPMDIIEPGIGEAGDAEALFGDSATGPPA